MGKRCGQPMILIWLMIVVKCKCARNVRKRSDIMQYLCRAKRKQRRRQQQKQHQRRAFSVLATPSHTSSVNMEEYCASKSSPEPPLLKSLREETANVFPEAAGMLSGHLQGRLLATLSHMISPESVLEIGTFTGYSALCLSEGLRPGGSLLTVESDSRAAEVAQRYFRKNSTSKQVRLSSNSDVESFH